LSKELDESIKQRIVIPTVQGLAEDRLNYRGFLSIQLMLTEKGPRVLEFNARLGDPETQSILTRFRGNLAELLMDCAMGRLDSTGSEVAFGKHWAVSIVIARKGYPNDESADAQIGNLEKIKNSNVFHSGSSWNSTEKRWNFSSGRLITLTSLGDTLAEARQKCYSDLGLLSLKNVHFRNDIGAE